MEQFCTCLGDYLVVVSNDSNSLEWKLRALVDDGTAFNWTEVAAFVVTGEPNDIWSVGSYAFVVGDGGYIYGLADPTGAATVLDAGVAVQDNLNAVHALDDQFVVAVGDNDAVVWAQDGATFAAGTGALGGNNLQSIWIKGMNPFIGHRRPLQYQRVPSQ